MANVKYYYGLGRRKTAEARVRLIPDNHGIITINGIDHKTINPLALEPLSLVGLKDKFSISVKVSGGGVMSRLGAIKLGIARALVKFDSELKTTLKKADHMTRDPREKERKKPGLKRARKAPQWQKR